MALGTLVLELQGNVARTQQDMAGMVAAVKGNMERIDNAAAATSRNIRDVAAAGGGIKRLEGADTVVKDLDNVSHATVGARREMLVLAHELSQGNFKRAAGSFMVLGERMDWMSKIMSPMGAAIGLVALAVGGMAYAFYEASKASAEFNNALLMTGGYSAFTEKSFREMSNQIADDANVSNKAATEAGLALIKTGQFQVTSIHETEMAMLNWMKVTGENAETSSKAFARMREDAVKWAEENNSQYHAVTGAQLQQMEALKKLGDEQGAYQILLHAVFEKQGGDVEHAITLWEKFIKVMEDAGMAEGTQAPAFPVARLPPSVVENTRESGHLQQAQEAADARTADTQDVIFQATKRDIVFQKEFATRKMKRDEEIADKTRDDKLMLKSAEDTAKDIALINEKYKDKKTAGGGAIAHADMESQLKPMQDQITAEDKLMASRETVLKQYYKDDELSIAGYFDTRRIVLEANLKTVSQHYDQLIAIEVAYAAKSKGAQSIEASTKANALRDAKQAAVVKSGEEIALTTIEQKQATEAYAAEVEKLTSELDKLNNRQGNSAGADFDRQNAGLKKRASAENDSGTLSNLTAARAAAVAEGEMNVLKKQADVITEALGVTEKRIALEEETGQKTTLAGMLELSKARTDAAAQLEVIAQKNTAVANSSGMPALITNAQQFQTQVDTTAASADTLGKSFQNSLTNGFAGMLDNSITRTKTLKQEFISMANSILQGIDQIVSKDLANAIFGTATGSGSGGGASGLFAQLASLFGGSSAGASIGAGTFSMPTMQAADTEGMSALMGLAGGGPASAGGMYEVNERGPELLTVANKTFLMMGDQPGSVTPTGTSKGAANTFNMQIAVPAGTTRQSAQQQAGAIMRQANIAMARNN